LLNRHFEKTCRISNTTSELRLLEPGASIKCTGIYNTSSDRLAKGLAENVCCAL